MLFLELGLNLAATSPFLSNAVMSCMWIKLKSFSPDSWRYVTGVTEKKQAREGNTQ